MGCDVHMRIERRENGEWLPVEQKVKNEYYTEESSEWESEYVVESWYRGRNYGLFSALADVRNHGEIEPISQPKGLPSDVSDDVRKDYESWDMDAHSASYFNLYELNKYHRTNNMKEISEEFYKMMQRMQKMVVPDGFIPKKPAVKKPAVNPLAMNKDRVVLLDNVNIPEQSGSETNIRIVFWFDN